MLKMIVSFKNGLLLSKLNALDSVIKEYGGEAVFVPQKSVEAQNTSTNNQSTRCHCGNQSVAHFCQQCLKTHDEYCKIPF